MADESLDLIDYKVTYFFHKKNKLRANYNNVERGTKINLLINKELVIYINTNRA